MARFRNDIETAMLSDADGRVAQLAQTYQLDQGYVELMIPRIYIRTGIRADLQSMKCTGDEIESCYQHVCLMLNGLLQKAIERKKE